MIAVKDGISGAENQSRICFGTQLGEVAGQIDIDSARKFEVSLAKVDIRQRCGVDNRMGLDHAQDPGQLIWRRRVTNMPLPSAPVIRHRTARHRVHPPVTAGLSQDTAGHKAMRAGYEQLSFGVHWVNNSVLMKKLKFPSFLHGAGERKVFFGLIWFNWV